MLDSGLVKCCVRPLRIGHDETMALSTCFCVWKTCPFGNPILVGLGLMPMDALSTHWKHGWNEQQRSESPRNDVGWGCNHPKWEISPYPGSWDMMELSVTIHSWRKDTIEDFSSKEAEEQNTHTHTHTYRLAFGGAMFYLTVTTTCKFWWELLYRVFLILWRMAEHVLYIGTCG